MKTDNGHGVDVSIHRGVRVLRGPFKGEMFEINILDCKRLHPLEQLALEAE